jgi:anti-sigma factor RsiW
MSLCDEYSVKTLLYLDNGLQGQELDDFRTHLASCANCRAGLEQERALSRLLERSRPLYVAPAVLRARVSAALMQHSAATATQKGFYDRVLHMLEKGLRDPARRVSSVTVLVPALVVIGLFLAFVPNIVRQVRAANYVETATATHRTYLEGNLPLGLRSSSPEVVTAWFANKVPFHFRLPNVQSIPASIPAYRLTGAGLVHYKGAAAAIVTYEKQNEKISLLVASNKAAVVAGGDEVRFGALTFHYRRNNSFNVITWSTHGLSYALVSSVSGPARESCLVCHQTMADHQDFKPGP